MKQVGAKTLELGWIARVVNDVKHSITAFWQSDASPMSGEESLLQEVRDSDQRDPSSYRPNLIVSARRMLANGRDYGMVLSIYGPEIASEAQRQVKSTQSPVSPQPSLH